MAKLEEAVAGGREHKLVGSPDSDYHTSPPSAEAVSVVCTKCTKLILSNEFTLRCHSCEGGCVQHVQVTRFARFHGRCVGVAIEDAASVGEQWCSCLSCSHIAQAVPQLRRRSIER